MASLHVGVVIDDMCGTHDSMWLELKIIEMGGVRGIDHTTATNHREECKSLSASTSSSSLDVTSHPFTFICRDCDPHGEDGSKQTITGVGGAGR